MAWDGDFAFLRRLITAGVVQGPVLEVGSRDHQGGGVGNAKATCESAGVAWEGADIESGPGVDRLLDILDPESVAAAGPQWRSVLLFNLLEHVYDPLTALRHATQLVAPGGTVAISGPAVWDLHDYPADYWRPMPGVFFEHARRENLEVVPATATWILGERLIPYESLRVGDQHALPSDRFVRIVHGPPRGRLVSLVERVAERIGHGGFHFPFCGFGIAMRRPAG